MGKPLRGAIVGFGAAARGMHAPAFQRSPGFEIRACVDPREEGREDFQSSWPGGAVFPSLGALADSSLGREIDFIDVASPPAFHAGPALEGLRRGWHVLCEKPLTMARDELSALEREAARSGRALFTVHNWAFSPQWREAIRIAGSGVLGEVRHAQVHVLRQAPAASAGGSWREDPRTALGGIAADHGWHCFYLLRRLVPAPLAGVRASLAFPGRGALEEEASIFIAWEGGATALVRLSWKAPKRSNWAWIEGRGGSLEIRDDHLIVDAPATGARRLGFDRPLSASSTHAEWFQEMLPEFRAACAGGEQALRNREEARFCLEVLLRAYESSPRP